MTDTRCDAKIRPFPNPVGTHALGVPAGVQPVAQDPGDGSGTAVPREQGEGSTGTAVLQIHVVGRPLRQPARRRTDPTHTSRPDGDKLMRSTLDALKVAGVYQDDANVVIHTGRKFYSSGHSGALIHVYVGAST